MSNEPPPTGDLTSDHPSPEILLRFLRQQLDPERERAVDAHVSSCTACEQRLAAASEGQPWPLDPVARLLNDPTLASTLGGPDAAGLPTLAPAPGPKKNYRPSQVPLAQVPGYEVLEELGRGGMGVVFKAKQTQLGRLVALKMILSEMGSDPEKHRRFRLEAEAAARIRHPNIVQIHDVGEHEGRPFLVLEYIDGGSLAQRLDGKPWPPADAALLVEELAQAVHEAHAHGIVHRDLKPSNVLLPRKELTPKVSDFGLAKFLDRTTHQTRTGNILGTPQYMAPEQAAGLNDKVGPATDVYALGAILYELLTGRPPFQGQDLLALLEQVRLKEPIAPRRLQGDVPRDLETICLKCLAKEAARRYASAQDLADDLRRWRQGEPIAARRPGWGERALLWARRRPVEAFAGFLLILLLAVGGVALALWLDSGRAQELVPEGNGPPTGKAQDQAGPRDIQGHWLCASRTENLLIRLAVRFTQQADGSYAGTITSRTDPRGVRIDAIRFEDPSLRFEFKAKGLVLAFEGELKEKGQVLEGQLTQGPEVFPLTFRRQAREPTLGRAQEPVPPLPYREEEVAFVNPGGVKLAGTLTLPPGPGPFPAVLLITGTSAAYGDRDKSMFGHKPYLVLADQLARRGLAVLRYDGPGVNGSGGSAYEPPDHAASAADALAALAFLKAHKEIEPKKIGLIGYSWDGCVVAPAATSRFKEAAFLILLGPSGLPGGENQALLWDADLKIAGADEKSRDRHRLVNAILSRLLRENPEDLRAIHKFEEAWTKELAPLAAIEPPITKTVLKARFNNLLVPGMRFLYTHDPRPDLRGVACPVLALSGEKDLESPPRENLPQVVAVLKEAGNTDVTVRELPGLNHLLQTSKTGHPAEYIGIEETIAPAALELVTHWAWDRFGIVKRPGGD